MAGTGSVSDDAVRAVLGTVDAGLSAGLPRRTNGVVPTVERQWRWVLADASLIGLCEQLCGCAERIAALDGAAPRQVGRALPHLLRELAETRARLAGAIEEVGWFAPPSGDAHGAEADRLIEAAERLLQKIERGLAEPELASLSGATGECKLAAAGLAAALAAPCDETPPIELVRELFEVPAEAPIASGSIEPNALRGMSGLDSDQMDELSRRLLDHLLPPTAQWVPNPTIFLAGVLLAERPLIAHRMALFMRDLVSSVFASKPKRAVEALISQRASGASQFASYREIAAEIETLGRAESADDTEGVALGTARLYAAGAEGPVRGAATTLLRLLGVPIQDKPSLTFLRDQLKGRTGASVDFSHALEPEWRNAVDHREAHWDPAAGLLDLRGEKVLPDAVFARYAFGASGVAGVECGITIAAATSPELLDRVDKAAPLHGDRVLVEHRLGQQLAQQGIKLPKVRITPSGLQVGPLPDEDLINALGALSGAHEHLRDVDRLEIQFEGLPPLVTTAAARDRAQRLRRRDGGNGFVLDESAAVPIFVGALIEDGLPPSEALDRGARAAGQAFALSARPNERTTQKQLARRLHKGAKRARQTIRETELAIGGASAGSTRLREALRRFERSASRHLDQGSKESMLADLRQVYDVLDELPGDPLPWFPAKSDPETGQD